MTQIATVERILDADHAEISVPRKSACGHDCEECAGCGVTGAAVHARASNPIGARPGQKVVVESSTKNMLRIVVLVYLIPVVLFLAGYVIMSLLTDSVAAQYAVAAAGFAAGIVRPGGPDDPELRLHLSGHPAVGSGRSCTLPEAVRVQPRPAPGVPARNRGSGAGGG